jgi:predicted porin
VSGAPERQRSLGATNKPVSTVLEYGAGAVASMVAYERNSMGDKDVFVAGKYTFGAAAVMAAVDDSRAQASDRRSRAATLSATYRTGPRTVFKLGYSRQKLYAQTNRFASLGADYALSRRSTVYVSLGRKRDAGLVPHTAFGAGMAHTF